MLGGALSKQQEIVQEQTRWQEKKYSKKYKQFAFHCKGFMKELFLKGYLRESTKSPNNGKVGIFLIIAFTN